MYGGNARILGGTSMELKPLCLMMAQSRLTNAPARVDALVGSPDLSDAAQQNDPVHRLSPENSHALGHDDKMTMLKREQARIPAQPAYPHPRWIL
jgi:hypothetical protein